MGVEVLLQLDRLVQLLESPPFTRLRLHLLQPTRHAALVRCPPPPGPRRCRGALQLVARMTVQMSLGRERPCRPHHSAYCLSHQGWPAERVLDQGFPGLV